MTAFIARYTHFGGVRAVLGFLHTRLHAIKRPIEVFGFQAMRGELTMTRCARCVLPDRYPAVSFDSEGICSHCREHERSSRHQCSQFDEASLLEAVKESKSRNAEYDCIVPMSGGRDSSYVASVMTRRFGLRVLGLNYDNGFRSEMAVQNLDNLTNSLGISLITLKVEPSLVRSLFGHFLCNVGYFCTACDALGYIVLGSFIAKEATRLGFWPLVVGGWSKRYEYQDGISVLSMRKFGEVLAANADLEERLLKCVLVDSRVMRRMLAEDDIRVSNEQRPEMQMQQMQLPSHVEWDYEVIERDLRQLGWKSPENGRSAHFDCTLAAIPEYLKNRKYGLSQETIRNSVLIREGKMTREEALVALDLEHTSKPPIFDRALTDFGIDEAQVAWDTSW